MAMEHTYNRATQFVLGGILILTTIWGCAGPPPPALCTSTECLIQRGEAPKWINEPQAFSNDPDMVYGVGSSSGIPNKSLLRRAAQEKAKSEIASLFQTSVMSSFSKTASVASGFANVSREESVVKEVLENLVNTELVGAKIVAVWASPYESEAYSLAGLNKALACENIVSGLKKDYDMQDDRMDAMKRNCLKL